MYSDCVCCADNQAGTCILIVFVVQTTRLVCVLVVFVVQTTRLVYVFWLCLLCRQPGWYMYSDCVCCADNQAARASSHPEDDPDAV